MLSRYAALVALHVLVALPLYGQSTDLSPFYGATAAFLSDRVHDGRVDYAAIKEQPAALDALLASIAAMDRSTLAPADDKAFLVNAYNLLVIKTVVDRLPIASPLDDSGFFSGASYTVAGATLTLDELEKKTLFATYPDPRLHFALVCAARGCPELIAEAYRGPSLDAQLDRQTRNAMQSDRHVRYDPSTRTAYLSELFTWYAGDFTRDHRSVLAFVNAYRASPIPLDAHLASISYDWQLNN